MFYLLILESIGTSELILIGLVALIIFGPRKLPEFARMLGKAMNDFRRTTDDFKETWAREVDFETEEKLVQTDLSALSTSSNSIQRVDTPMRNEIVAPEIKSISQAEFQTKMPGKEKLPEKDSVVPQRVENAVAEKRDWL